MGDSGQSMPRPPLAGGPLPDALICGISNDLERPLGSWRSGRLPLATLGDERPVGLIEDYILHASIGMAPKLQAVPVQPR